jgi:hypothetical protein
LSWAGGKDRKKIFHTRLKLKPYRSRIIRKSQTEENLKYTYKPHNQIAKIKNIKAASDTYCIQRNDYGSQLFIINHENQAGYWELTPVSYFRGRDWEDCCLRPA